MKLIHLIKSLSHSGTPLEVVRDIVKSTPIAILNHCQPCREWGKPRQLLMGETPKTGLPPQDRANHACKISKIWDYCWAMVLAIRRGRRYREHFGKYISRII